MQEFDDLKKIVEEMESEVQKVDGGNKSAGTRVRKLAQEAKSKCQDIRKAVIDKRNAEE